MGGYSRFLRVLSHASLARQVGNGCIGSEAGHCGNDPLNSLHDVQTWRGHALIPQTLADAITAHCSWNLPSLECDALVLEAQLLTNELDI